MRVAFLAPFEDGREGGFLLTNLSNGAKGLKPGTSFNGCQTDNCSRRLTDCTEPSEVDVLRTHEYQPRRPACEPH